MQIEQKRYDKHPENKDNRDDSTLRDNLCRYQGLISPYTCVCVSEGRGDGRVVGKIANRQTSCIFNPSKLYLGFVQEFFFRVCVGRKKIQLHTRMLTKEELFTFVFFQCQEEASSRLFSK